MFYNYLLICYDKDLKPLSWIIRLNPKCHHVCPYKRQAALWHFVTEAAETNTHAKITLFADRLVSSMNELCPVSIWIMGWQTHFPGISDNKDFACNVGDPGSIPESERSPGEGNGNPLQCSCWRIPWTEKPGGLQSMGS